MPPSFSLLDAAIGKADASIEARMPIELKEAIAAKARKMGFRGGSSEAIRFVMANWAWGEEHVSSLIQRQVGVYGTSVPLYVPTSVRTDVPTDVPTTLG